MWETDTQYWAIAFDCFGDQQEGVSCTGWQFRPRYDLDSEGGFQRLLGP